MGAAPLQAMTHAIVFYPRAARDVTARGVARRLTTAVRAPRSLIDPRPGGRTSLAVERGEPAGESAGGRWSGSPRFRVIRSAIYYYKQQICEEEDADRKGGTHVASGPSYHPSLGEMAVLMRLCGAHSRLVNGTGTGARRRC
jgi:hypothetical protein